MPCKCLTTCRKQIYRTQVQRIHTKEYPYKYQNLQRSLLRKIKLTEKPHSVRCTTAQDSYPILNFFLVKLRSSIKIVSTRKHSTQASHGADCSEDFTALVELDSQKFDSTGGERSSQTLMEKKRGTKRKLASKKLRFCHTLK